MPATTTSYSEYSDFPTQEKYLINTQKIVKGHKITLKDTIRKQIIKSRALARSHHPKPSPQPIPDKITEYTEKYHALETIDDENEMLRFIFYKRFKQSRASERGIKLFSRQTTRPKTTSADAQTNRFVSARATKTSQTKRSSLQHQSKYKSLEYEGHNSFNDSKKSNIHFSSDNIDSRMTEYLNLILEKKEKDQMYITEQEIREISQGIAQREDMLANMLEIRNGRQKSVNNSFLRQMKKHQNAKNKTQRTSQKASGSDQLVKSLKRKNLSSWQSTQTDKNSLNTFAKSASKYCSIEMSEDPVGSLSKQTKFQKSYLSTVTPQTYETESKGIKTAMTSARKQFY